MTQDWTSFTIKIAVKSTLSTIYNAWTKSSEIEKWFLEIRTYKDGNNRTLESDQNVRPKDVYEWAWYDCGADFSYTMPHRWVEL